MTVSSECVCFLIGVALKGVRVIKKEWCKRIVEVEREKVEWQREKESILLGGE
jgi:hypothetical protein